MIVTCRSVAKPEGVNPAALWFIEECDLRFTAIEVKEMLDLAGIQDQDGTIAPRMLERSGGQAALLGMMLLHDEFVTGEVGAVPTDLVWYLDHIISRLSDTSIRGLYCAGLMRAGRLAELDQAVPLGIDEWRRLSSRVPLLLLGTSESPARTSFTVHAVLAEALCEIAEARLRTEDIVTLREAVILILIARDDMLRVLDIISARSGVEERARWCEKVGPTILQSTGPAAVIQCLESLSPMRVSGSARLLLLWAAALRQQDRLEEAVAKARIARSSAEYNHEWDVQVDACLLLARLGLDVGDIGLVEDTLAPLDGSTTGRLTSSARCLLEAYLAVAAVQAGRVDEALARSGEVRELLRKMEPASESYVFAVNCVAGTLGMYLGDWAAAAQMIEPLSTRVGVPMLQGLLIRCNFAASQLELGRISRAEDILREAVNELRGTSSRQLLAHALSTAACVAALVDSVDSAVALQDEAMTLSRELDDLPGAAILLTYWAPVARGCGLVTESLQVAEDALATALSVSAPLLVVSRAECEVAASLLANGDRCSAKVRTEGLRSRLGTCGANYHMLAADAVLAEVARQEGSHAEAVSILQQHRDYILTESANWLLAMYIRTFPGLLGVLAAGIGADAVPVHLLRMIPPPYASTAIAEATEVLTAEDIELLAHRLEVDPPAGIGQAAALAPTWPCYVKMFGGLEVITEYGVMGESEWQRRKARAILTMLVVKRQDIPRDIIIERLWPGKDGSTALQNFYVGFSALKADLSRGGERGCGGQYLQHKGGLCRLTSLVRTELEDFDEAVEDLCSADRAGDSTQVQMIARRIVGIYRGDLLPGDLYEDWVIDVRERVAQDFCDAMVTAARVSRDVGNHEAGITLLRRAVSAVPEREDLYRELMLCQLHAGQRSSGIQTFFACKRVLADQLGMDPSEETVAIYMQLLAMEERDAAVASLYLRADENPVNGPGDLVSCWDL